MDSNLCLKYVNWRRWCMHQLWESRNDGEYFKLCKILTEFPDKFRKYFIMNIKAFDYILDSVKYDLQSYSNFRKCIEAEEKLTVALQYVLVIVVRINRNYICKILNAIIIQCNIKWNYTRKIRVTLNWSKLHYLQTNTNISCNALTYVFEIFQSIQLRRWKR